MALIKKLRKAKKDAPAGDKPAVVKTHLRDMIIVPEMIGSVIGIYNGKVFSELLRSTPTPSSRSSRTRIDFVVSQTPSKSSPK